LHLSPEEIAAAEACGVSFLPASDAQVQRLAMQRKVFYLAGAPILATRGDGLFETAGTLQQLIDEGRQQQRDLSQWLEPSQSATGAESEALPEPAPEADMAKAAPMASASLPAPTRADLLAPPPKRQRQKQRRHPDLPVLADPEPAASAQAVEAGSSPDHDVGTAEMESTALPPAVSRTSGRTATRAPANTVEAPGQDRGKRWLMAGATRRGRAGKHWSTRQR
jgi:hypothetical protein